MSDEESTIDDTPAATSVQAPEPPVHKPIEEEGEWLQEPVELPRRPRRRMLAPIPLALLGVLLIACGFIGGVLTEKGQSTSSSSTGAASGLASRFAALRGGASGAGARSGTTSTGGAVGGSSGSSSGARPVAGQVAYLAGSTLYVTDSEGNTVKVTTSVGTSVTKTVNTSLKGIHPGETVTVTGATNASGTLSAESIRVGAGGGGGGLAALLGGSGASGGAGTTSGGSGGGSSSGSGGGAGALFGSGG